MAKSRSFSIYLLKATFNADNALKAETNLEAGVEATGLPEGAILHILDGTPYNPWWVGYFGIQKDLRQVSKGALVFLPAADRHFALSFGHVAHNLRDESYEYDFGLRVTLNCIDPNKLRSTDILEPSGAKRQRTQLPTAGDLTFFDVDGDSTILKSLTGKVKEEHKNIFKNATGSSNIRVSTPLDSAGLMGLCGSLLSLYKSDAYKAAFPDIQNISPVRDPIIISALNQKLLSALQFKDDGLALTVPDIVDFGDGLWGAFTGVGAGKIHDDILIGNYYDYLLEFEKDVNHLTIDDLKRHQLVLTNDDGSLVRDRHSIFKSLIFDTQVHAGGETYHLCDGNWYLVDKDYVAKLEKFLDPMCQDTVLPDFNHADEGAYNLAASAADGRVCLDKTNISPAGQKQVEPCDIYEVINGRAVLHCVKISTLSAQLSHLFNQGINSVNLMRSENAALNNMKTLVSAGLSVAEGKALIAPLSEDKLKVSYGIVTKKDKAGKSKNLPLFSRISLMRCMKEFKRMGIESEYCFILDTTSAAPPKTRKRKKKAPLP